MDYTPYFQRMAKERKKKAESLEKKYERAWEVAKSAAQILKEKYSAREVVVFGSLVHKELFHLNSDIDLSVRGIEPQRFFQALSEVAFMDHDLNVELVDIEECKDYIAKAIKEEGVKL